MACHIAAASGGPGARRYVADMRSEERASIDNGVWMCYTHGKEVDTDEKRFSIPMLKKWRELAEFRAQWVLDYGIEKPLPQYVVRGRIGFADEEIKITALGAENELVGKTFLDCCVETMWPVDIARTVRDTVIELVRNSLTHGAAKECKVAISKHAIYVRDDGLDFSCLDLEAHKSGRGGAAAIRYLLAHFSNQVIVGAKRIGGSNETMFAPAGGHKGVMLTTPCAVQLDRNDWEVIKEGDLPARLIDISLNQCRLLYIVLPDFLTPSDAYKLREKISVDAVKDKKIVFVASGASELVSNQLQKLFPGCRILVPS
jgi:hypothetical protein